MIKLIKKLYNNKVIKYIFFGGLATLVNIGSFYILRRFCQLDVNIANVISIALAIVFAYFTNSKFVFCSQVTGIKEHLTEFVKFVSVRITTMIIEIGGVWLFVDKIHMNDLLAKFIIQFVVLVLNYIFSKFLIFNKTQKKKDS